MKAPSSNIQAPEKLQVPSFKGLFCSQHDVGNLKLGISLVLGAWMLELFLL
jgi:hypothetical protein